MGDFRAASGLKKPTPGDVSTDGSMLPNGDCWVCESYRGRGDDIVADFVPGDFEKWGLFRPLEEAPDLFLRFAKVWREPDFRRAAVLFSNRYGLPFGASGGLGDQVVRISFDEFNRASKRAWVALSLYESVVNRDEEAARKLFRENGDEDATVREWRDRLNDAGQDGVGIAPLRCALAASADTIGGTALRLCAERAVLHFAGEAEPDPSCLKMTWTFDNLLGAMYLQMWWVMLAGGDLARCGHCGRLMSLTRPNPEGRKRRRDKRFCDDACRQAHHRSKKRS
jgi:hypothetical protein